MAFYARQLVWLLLMPGLFLSCSETRFTPDNARSDGQQRGARTTTAGLITNLQTGKSYISLQKAFDELPATFTQSYELELSGTLVAASPTLRSKNMGSFGLVLRGINGGAELDANGSESAVVFNGTSPANIRNITLENLTITNYSQTSGNTAGVRFFTVKGQNLLKNVVFTGGYVAMRATVKCEDITFEDVDMQGVMYGGPRLGQATDDVGHVVFRRLKTTLDQSPGNLNGADNVCQLKGLKSLLVEDCTFDGATKTILDMYAMSNITIRRNVFIRSGRNNQYGISLQLLPATGQTCRNLLIENNLFDNPHGTAIYVRAADYTISNNTFVEASTTRPLLSLEASSGTIELFNNIFDGISNSNPIISLYQVNATRFEADHNLYHKPAGSNRLLIKGSTGQIDLTATTLAQLQTKGQESGGLQSEPQFNADGQASQPAYMLRATSPGRNAADPAHYGSSDLSGNLVTSAPPDMGAYDYDSL